ncbi:MAG TPA: gamma-glutamyl-gamma-aminobutyrate hydrolase family protein [Pseudonocardiaceae bacterium]|nr:gamma-glutamyl-gamma-aminobutyrate hydrolase family protein [Pseudonocardiaceae bacterium]
MASNASDPVIGITTYAERTRFGVWDLDAMVLPRTYPDTVARAGGIPVLLPPIGAGFSALIGRLDGLLLSGGADVDPARYQQSAHAETDRPRTDRDAYEFALLAQAMAADLPILAVCRGMQVLNSALGGTLCQHVPDAVGHHAHRPELGVFGENRIRLATGSRTAALLGSQTKGRCHHHQALDAVAESLSVVGTADDGTIEAVEAPDHHFVLGVQWHPEEDTDDDRLVAALVAAARERGGRR